MAIISCQSPLCIIRSIYASVYVLQCANIEYIKLIYEIVV